MKLLNLKEEIKEILEELENMYEISELEEQVNNINKIRDYIINLQQENKQLKSIVVELEEIIKNKIKCFKEDKDYFIDEKDMYELDNLIKKLKEK